MPASITWKEMYRLEYEQLCREGYRPAGAPPSGESSPGELTRAEEERWQTAYAGLLSCRAGGVQPDYPYREPDGLAEILADADEPPTLTPLTQAEYRDRIFGAWNGRLAGVALGKPLEIGWDRGEIRAYLESVDAYPLDDYVPFRSERLNRTLKEDCLPSSRGHVAYVQSDDDVHYTICSLLLMEKCGERFTLWDAAQNLLENVPYHWVWTADRALYYDLVHMNGYEMPEAQCARMGDTLNPWRESMCPQLKADFWGYVTPGEVRRGAGMIHRLGFLSARKNGLYGGMFLQGCVSGALSANPTPETILRCGLSNVPRRSRLYEAIRLVMDWYRETPDWEAVCDRIYGRYGDWYFAGAINNLCFIALSLLEGKLDYARTVATAVMCGTDTDCNAGNAGSIVGAAVGLGALPRRFIDPLNDSVHSGVAGFGFGSITELAERTIAQRERLLRTGG